jgi:hypothetical protein
MQSRTSSSVLIAILIILTFPIWIGLIAGAFGIVAGVFGAVFGIIGGIFGIIFGGLGAAFGWIFEDPFFWPEHFHFGFLFGKIFLIAIVILLVVSVSRRRR